MKRFHLVAIVLLAAPCVRGQVPPSLLYDVEVKDGDATAFYYALTIDRPGTDVVKLSVAAWAPGSYRLMNVFRNITNVSASDGTGVVREVTKEGDLTWVVDARGARRLTVRWQFSDPGRGVNNRSYLNQSAGLIDGPRNYLYWRDHKHLPAHVRFKLPAGWKVATGLDATFDPMTFLARDADVLLDSPALVGKIETWTFDIGGVPHRVALDNRARPVGFDIETFLAEVRKITEAAIDIFGHIPYPHYTYIFSAGGGGGLEHLTSTTIGVNTSALADNVRAHHDTIAHEVHHAWNVKRLRPRELGPFDYDGPVRTRGLWFAEGITSYYTNVILARAGLLSEEGFIGGYERTIASFIANPASLTMSPEEASRTVWDYPYMQGPISYYTQGEILGLLIDLEIRGATANAKSFDDAMRLLYERYSGAQGFLPEDVPNTIRDATGVDLSWFFRNHVAGAREIDWGRHFAHMGCAAGVMKRPRTAINVESAVGGEGGVVVQIGEHSALARLGLEDDDVITELNGAGIASARDLIEGLRKLEPGGPIKVAVRRGGDVATVSGTVEAATDVGDLFRGRARRLGVMRLAEGSPLHESGLREGDVVVAVNDAAVANGEQYRAATGALRVGDVARLKVERTGAVVEVEHKIQAAFSTQFELLPDPAATPVQLAIRRGILTGARDEAAETRPARRAG